MYIRGKHSKNKEFVVDQQYCTNIIGMRNNNFQNSNSFLIRNSTNEYHNHNVVMELS